MSAGEPPLRCVIDASVGFKWLVEEEGSVQADTLLDAMTEADARFHVPQLFYIEVTNILWKAVRRKRIDAALAYDALASLQGFKLQSHNVEGLAADALKFALDAGITAYDATYVALSAMLDVPLITADAVLRRQVHDRIDVRMLSEMG